jgi:hypothetical protein
LLSSFGLGVLIPSKRIKHLSSLALAEYRITATLQQIAHDVVSY